jgi:hypothetical protein
LKQYIEEKKYAPQFNRSTCKKILSLIGPAVLEKKGENIFFGSKTGFEKNSKQKKNFFSFFFFFFLFILNHYRFCFIAHYMRTEKAILEKYRHPKLSCFRDCATWCSSNFYSTNRAHLNALVEMKIEKSKNRKKKFFWLGKGGVPLRSNKSE